MKHLRHAAALLGALILGALAAASPALAQTVSWSQTNDYTPSGGPISAGAAGTALNSGGWKDVHGNIWSVNSSNQLAEAVNSSYSANNSEITAPVSASTPNQRLRVKFVAAGNGTNLYAMGALFRYSNSGTSTNAYTVALNNGINSGRTTISFNKVVSGTQTTIGSSTDIGATLTSGTTYCLDANAVQTNSGTTTLTGQLYQSDCATAVGSQAQTSDSTASLQNINNGIALWGYTANYTAPINELTTYSAPLGLLVGQLSATPGASSVVLSLSANPSGGSGSGYNCNIYRGTDPNFTANAGSLLTNVTSFPYTDTPPAGVQEYYGSTCSDSANNTANVIPNGYSAGSYTGQDGRAAYPLSSSTLFYANAQTQGQDVNLVFIGDSITNGYLNANSGTASSPIITSTVGALKKLLGIRTVNPFNGGVGGTSTSDWLPPGLGGASSGSCTPGGGSSSACYYVTASASNTNSGASKLAAADPGAQMVFTIMLGANDSNTGISAANYGAYLTKIVNQILGTDWPNAKVVIHLPAYFTPNIYASGATLSLSYSYRPVIASVVSSLKATYPGHVFLGDALSYPFFAQNYLTEMWPQGSYGSAANGTGYLHPNAAGDADLGALWANAIGQALYAPAATAAGTTRSGTLH